VSDIEILTARVKALTEQVAELAAANIALRARIEGGARDFELSADGPFLPSPFQRQAD
jgi:hypothetical protein